MTEQGLDRSPLTGRLVTIDASVRRSEWVAASVLGSGLPEDARRLATTMARQRR